MAGFLIVFFAIYSLMHAFVYSRVVILLGPSERVAAILFMALMIFAPVGSRMLERSGSLRAARACARAGYVWLGFIFYCFWGVLLVDTAGALLRVANFVGGFSLPVFAGPAAPICVLAAAAGINVYGYFEARSVRVERLVLKSSKLPAGIDRLRIAQISDVHLGLTAGPKRMERILRGIEAERPDILVGTGDLIDGKLESSEAVAALFSRIRTRLGKFAVTGNHEVYAGLEKSIEALRAWGFTVLRGEARRVGDILNIVGVDDPAADSNGDEAKILESAQNELFTLLLKHRPHPAGGSLGLFDLQLSGHTHYGQLFPFRYMVELSYPLQNGPYHLSKGSVLYVSRGSGSWGPPVRVLARPEVTIIEVERP
ncbi:MAG: metallophosphoesterase [Syntrophobacteraceae bacterium]|nr:metallophosphoesterase [Syntrophobacteraceae bacterium]